MIRAVVTTVSTPREVGEYVANLEADDEVCVVALRKDDEGEYWEIVELTDGETQADVALVGAFTSIAHALLHSIE